MKGQTIYKILNAKVKQYEQFGFIENDPIMVPHLFSQKVDIEIAGLFAAVFAWGQRVTIINKCKDLLGRMDNAPHQFITQHQEVDLKRMLGFSHRTFNDTDLLYFISFLRQHYQKHSSLEEAFSRDVLKNDATIEKGLVHFRNYFFSLEDAPVRTEKHIASPLSGSACKRLNMYLRWMVRSNDLGVDFGIWKQIKPSQLVCPLDVHSGRVARKLGLLQRQQDDWTAAIELTENLKSFDPNDPIKYDFALFGMGVEREM